MSNDTTILTNLATLQTEHAAWLIDRFGHHGDRLPDMTFAGIVEEVGELARHHLKREQKTHGSEAEHDAGARDAIGDIVVFLCGYCTSRGWNISEIVEAVWADVKTRAYEVTHG